MSASNSVQAPKGTRDFYPEEMRVQNHIFDGWRKVCLAFGFEEYEGPTFEHLDLFTGKSGPEITAQLYNFKDKGERDLALRPEMTPTLARMVNQKGNSLKLPLRWFSIPRLFRYERAQKGRLREFFQLNMDIIGCNTIAAETDLLIAIVEMLKGLGLGKEDFSIRISSRRLLSEFLDRQDVPIEKKPAVYTALDKRAKIGEAEFINLLTQEGISSEQCSALESFFGCKSLPEILQWMGDKETQPNSAFSELESLLHTLNSTGYADFIELDMSVVRGLAYYTGVVFEVFDKARSLRAIAGGGRYDNLLATLGGKEISGVGFGMGDVVLADLLLEKGLFPTHHNSVDYFLVDVASANLATPRLELLMLAKTLRAKGLRIAYSLAGEKVKKQMTQANDFGATKVIFFGSDQVSEGKVEVKDLTHGTQIVQTIEEL